MRSSSRLRLGRAGLTEAGEGRRPDRDISVQHRDRVAEVEAGLLGRLGEMPGPVLFVVDHDESSLRVLLADLTRRFGNDFTVKGDSSPEAALGALQEVASANEPVALMLVDGQFIRLPRAGPRAASACKARSAR